jgi:hypothetical protein
MPAPAVGLRWRCSRSVDGWMDFWPPCDCRSAPGVGGGTSWMGLCGRAGAFKRTVEIRSGLSRASSTRGRTQVTYACIKHGRREQPFSPFQ